MSRKKKKFQAYILDSVNKPRVNELDGVVEHYGVAWAAAIPRLSESRLPIASYKAKRSPSGSSTRSEEIFGTEEVNTIFIFILFYFFQSQAFWRTTGIARGSHGAKKYYSKKFTVDRAKLMKKNLAGIPAPLSPGIISHNPSGIEQAFR